MYRVLAPLLVISAVATAQAQLNEPRPTSHFLDMLPFIESDSLKSELSLTPDRLRSLIAFRQKVWDEDFKLTGKELAAGAEQRIRDADKLFIETLRADQAARLREIARQRLDL